MQKGLMMSNKEYRKAKGVSSTDLKKMSKSPAHFRYWKENGDEIDSPSLLFGRSVHKYMLEKDDFFKEFAVAPVVDRRTKAGKEEWSRFVEENAGKDIISAEDFKVIEYMHKALYETQHVKQLLSGVKERSFFVKDESTGIIKKCRPDCLTDLEFASVIIDYKSCNDASDEEFMKQAIKLEYDLQLAYYKDIVDEVTNEDCLVVFIAQEKTPPYAVNVLEANEYFIKSGRDLYRTRIDLYAECEKSGKWPGYVRGSINVLGLPGWLQKQYE